MLRFRAPLALSSAAAALRGIGGKLIPPQLQVWSRHSTSSFTNAGRRDVTSAAGLVTPQHQQLSPMQGAGCHLSCRLAAGLVTQGRRAPRTQSERRAELSHERINEGRRSKVAGFWSCQVHVPAPERTALTYHVRLYFSYYL